MAGTRSPEETMTIATAAAADEQAAAARRAVVETDGEFNFLVRFCCFVSQRSVACDARADTCPEKFRGRFPGIVIETTEAETTGSSHFACGDCMEVVADAAVAGAGAVTAGTITAVTTEETTGDYCRLG